MQGKEKIVIKNEQIDGFLKNCDIMPREKEKSVEQKAIDEVKEIVSIMEKDIQGKLSETERKVLLKNNGSKSLEFLREYFDNRERKICDEIYKAL